jgi:exodeoxyribonuclease-3
MVEPVRKAYAKLAEMPIQNMLRRFNPELNTYSFWDFQGGAWFKNNGILLDAIWVSDTLADSIQGACIYKDIRALKGTSDHAPVGIISKDIL